jgi:hypothetical protein
MSEAWREVARLGKKGEQYPHLLVDSHGWCLRLGPRDREDEKYYSSLPTLLQGLLEHFLRRKDQDSAGGLAELKALLIQNLKEAKELGEELERKLPNLRQRLLHAAGKTREFEGSRPIAPSPEIAAAAPEVGSEAA